MVISDWKYVDAVEDLIDKYHGGELSASEVLELIRNLLLLL